MYLTAQRVVAHSANRRGAEGVNAFFYLHGQSWPGPVPEALLPEHDPGIPTDPHDGGMDQDPAAVCRPCNANWISVAARNGSALACR
jgi:hypothetical protein